MQLLNDTPFAHHRFEAVDEDGSSVVVVVVQGTFDVQSGEPMRPRAEQVPVRTQDEYRGESRTSGLRHPTAAVIFRPQSDVVVNAIAHAPAGRPAPEWPVELRVGDLHRKIVVRGPHHWRHHSLQGWRLDAPRPVSSVPIVNELAFGGTWLVNGRPMFEPRNPIGTGFLPEGVPTGAPVPAPQIVAADEKAHQPGSRYVPRGFAAIPWYFAPRTSSTLGGVLALASPYSRCNAAHADLRYPGFLEGHEPISISRVLPGGATLHSALPGIVICGLLEPRSGSLRALRMRLDGLELDIDSSDPAQHRAYLVWRGVFPRALEPRLLALTAASSGEAGAETLRCA